MLAPSEFEGTPARGYLDSATYGLPPARTLAASRQALEGWRTRRRWRDWEEDGEACRELFAELVGATAADVALVPAVSVAGGLVAASLPAEPGDNVVVHDRDFTSTILPWHWLEARGIDVRRLPLERLAEGVDERTALVAVSLVQSADGRVVDVAALAESGARLFVDASQAAGAVPVEAGPVDYLATHGYKWLLCPRGLSFLYVRPDRRDEVVPWTAGWKSRIDPYEDYYGFPDLAAGARRLDVSLAWFSAAGARPSLELLRDIGIAGIAEHNLRLARAFAAGVGVPEPASPIVRVAVADAEAAVERLAEAGVACSARAGSVRLSFHLYNDDEDVELATAALSPLVQPSA